MKALKFYSSYKRKIIFLSVFLCLSMVINASAQRTGGLKKNIITLGLGLDKAEFSNTVGYNFSCERLFIKSQSFIKNYGLRAGIGQWVDGLWLTGPVYSVHFIGLTGEKASHLELGLGVTIVTRSSHVDYEATLPSVKIGYRYQKPQKGFVLSAGTGYPEILYMGIGVAF